MSEPLKLIGLFSGIGGLEMGVINAFIDRGIAIKPILHCEMEPYAVSVLKRHHPDVPIHSDVTTLVDVPAADVCVFGFPCQDVSIANTNNPKGLNGQRSGLFHEGWRIAKASGAEIIVIENVPAIRKRGLQMVIDTVLADGYRIEWDIVSAADVGAPHLRKRWFAVIYKQQGWGQLHEKVRLVKWLGEHPPARGAAYDGKVYEYRPWPKGSKDKTILFPTVTQDSSSERTKRYAQGGMPLTMAVNRWPTPRAGKVSGDSVGRFIRAKAEGKVHTPPLETAVWMADAKRFPTPTKSTAKGIGPIDSKSHSHNLGKRNLHAVVQESMGVTGKLSPEWTELLMGFPKGYTNPEGLSQHHQMVYEWGELLPISQQSEWETETPRQTTIMENRAKRIRALGNAVVPACAHRVVSRFLSP